MAKRKIENRRSSKYNRSGYSSGILDPNTEILGDERPYWWKDVENNTIARLSMGSDVFGETTHNLDSSSTVDINTPKEGWWKVLETPNTSIPLPVAKDHSRKDATNRIVSTSESEEESRIAKRKRSLRFKTRNTKSNAFLSALNSSKTSLACEPVQKNIGGSTVDSNASTEYNVNIKRLNKVQKSSSNDSQSTDIIMKVKPRIFEKKHKALNKNIFDNILKEDENQGIQMEQASMKHKTASPILNRSRLSQFSLSSMNEHNISASNAQSTLLENNSMLVRDSNKDNISSDTETIILKPKSKFLKRSNKIAKKTTFKNVLLEDEVDDGREINESINKNVTTKSNPLKRSLISSMDKISEITQPVPRSIVTESRTENSKQNPFLDILQEDDNVDSHETSGISFNSAKKYSIKSPQYSQHISKSKINDKENEISSNSHLNHTTTSNESIKPNTNSSKSHSRGTVSLSQSDEEDETFIDSAVSLIENSKEKSLNQDSQQKTVLGNENEPAILETNVGDGEQNDDMEDNQNENWLKFKVLSDSEEEEFELSTKKQRKRSNSMRTHSISTTTIKQDKKLSKSQNQSTSAILNEKQLDEIDNNAKRQSRNLNKSQKLSVSRTARDSDAENVEDVSRRRSKNLSNLNKLSSSAIVNALEQRDADNADEQNNKFNMSPALTLRSSSNFDEEGIEYSPKKQTGNLNTSRNQMVSAIANENEQSDVDNTGRRQSKNVSRLQVSSVSLINKELETESQSPENRSVINGEEEAQDSDESILTNPNKNTNTIHSTTSEIKTKPVESTIDKQNRTTSKSLRQSTTRINSDPESEDETPKKQRKRLSRSKRSDLYASNNIESNETDGSESKQSKSTSKLQRQSALRDESDSESEDQIRLKRQSKRSSRPQKQSISDIEDEDESVGGDNATTRQSKKISQVILHTYSNFDTQVETPSKRQSKRLSTSQIQANVSSKSSIPHGAELREIESDGNSQSKKINKSQRHSTLHIESDSEPEIQRSSKRQSRRISRLQTQSISDIADVAESDGTDNTENRQSRKITKSQRQSTLQIESDSEPENQRSSKRQSRRISKLQKQSISDIADVAESDGTDNTENRQSRKITKSQRQSTLQTESDSEPENQRSSKTRSRRLTRSQKQSILDIVDEAESDGTDNATTRQSKRISQVTLHKDSNLASKVETPSKRQSKKISQLTLHEDSNSVLQVETPSKRQSERLSRSQKQSMLDIVDEAESDGTDNATTRQSKRISQVTLHKDSNLASKVETPSKRQSKKISQLTLHEDSNSVLQVETPSKRQSERLSRSQKQSMLDIVDEAKLDGTDNATYRQSKRISQVTSHEDSNLVSQVGTTSKRQSERLSRSRKQSILDIVDKAESDGTDNATYRQSKRISQVTLHEDSNLVSQVETTSKRQSKRLRSKSQKRSLSDIVDKDEPDGTDNATYRQSKRISQVALHTDSNLVSKAETPPKGQSEKLSRVQKQSLSDTAGVTRQSKEISKPHHQSALQTDSNSTSKIETPSKKQSKGLIFEKELAVKVVDIALLHKVGDTANKRNESKSKSQRQSTSNAQSGAESEVEAPLNKSGNIPDKATVVDDVEPDQAKDTTEMRSRLSLEKELTEMHTDNSSGSQLQDDVDFRLSYTSSNLSSIQKQVHTMSKLKDRPTSNLDIRNTKGSGDASDAEEDVRETNKESLHESSYRAITNKVQNVDKDSRTFGTIFAPSDAHNSHIVGKNISTQRTESNKDKNLIASSKIPVASTSQRNIMDFFQMTKAVPMSQVLSDKQKLEEVNKKMEELKTRVLHTMNVDQKNRKTKTPTQGARTGNFNKKKISTQKKQPSKEVNKAFLVNGQVYKVPRLARPKPWVTKHLYNYLWKRMEPKYGLNTRVVSEKFINELSQITTLILKKKSYSKYRLEMQILMKEMARLGIIENRSDFYHFCQDFFPYELRIKLVPMLLPGNKKNFPFDLSKLYKSLNDN